MVRMAETEMLTVAAEARLMGLNRATVSKARRHETHPVHLRGADTIEMGSPQKPRLHHRAPRAAVEKWWAKRWAGASPDDLARKRRRPAPVPAGVKGHQEEKVEG
jgi:hypothetical protein